MKMNSVATSSASRSEGEFVRLGVGRPHERRPRPPDQREHQHRLAEAAPGQVAREQRRDLGDREHEHQVPEQLDRAGAPLRRGRRSCASALSHASWRTAVARRSASAGAARAAWPAPSSCRASRARSRRSGGTPASRPSPARPAARGRGRGRRARYAARGDARSLRCEPSSSRCSAIAARRSGAGPSSSSRLASRWVRRISSSRSVARRAAALARAAEGEPVPRLGERDEARPAAGAVGGEHRADPVRRACRPRR